jgi:acetoin:2,6-dichlorophenolindophenol oxidoreductase subunit beta
VASYKDNLTAAMDALAADPLACFVGYGVRKNGALGTFKNIRPEQLIEMPVAENLLVGAAMGMALAGRRPLVFIERMDFILNAADAIVNHLDKVTTLSRGEWSAGVIIRTVVGNRNKPLFTGEPHIQDFAEAFSLMLKMPVLTMDCAEEITGSYAHAADRQRRGESTMLVEYKDLI